MLSQKPTDWKWFDIKWNLEYFTNKLTDFGQEVVHEIFSKIMILTYIHHESSITIPIENIKEILYRVSLTKEQEKKKEQEKQRNFIRSLVILTLLVMRQNSQNTFNSHTEARRHKV